MRPDLPDYEIVGELGRGGMGVVFKARQKSLNRLVALKMVLAGQSDADNVARFRAEAEAIARIDHPNIIRVYEVGEWQKRPYFSLEYCPEGSLDRRLVNGATLPGREAAAIVVQAARAIHAAHEAGVVHRDLKPANILLTRSGVPKVTDFGIAKRTDTLDSATQTGVIMGTPSYMSPEQAGGRTREIGASTDIYSLGAILYECVTGRAPFAAPTPLETILQVTSQDPLPPRLLNRRIDVDLERIILRCLEKSAAQRYATAAELADDLGRYLAGEPIRARSVNLIERLQREIAHRNHDEHMRPWGRSLMLLGAALLLAHLATSTMLWAGSPVVPRVLGAAVRPAGGRLRIVLEEPGGEIVFADQHGRAPDLGRLGRLPVRLRQPVLVAAPVGPRPLADLRPVHGIIGVGVVRHGRLGLGRLLCDRRGVPDRRAGILDVREFDLEPVPLRPLLGRRPRRDR